MHPSFSWKHYIMAKASFKQFTRKFLQVESPVVGLQHVFSIKHYSATWTVGGVFPIRAIPLASLWRKIQIEIICFIDSNIIVEVKLQQINTGDFYLHCLLYLEDSC
jgi:hypothetical protein